MRKRLFIYLFSLSISLVGATLLFVYGEHYIAILPIVLVAISFFFIIREYMGNTKKMTYMLNALENNDSSFRFQDNDGDYYNTLFVETLNRINEMIASEKLRVREQEKYYELLLNNVVTGIVVINEKGEIENCNNKALELLGLSVFTHLLQLKKVSDTLYDTFTSEDIGDGKIISIHDESREKHLSLKETFVNIVNKKLKIMVINDIGEELEEKEIDAWSRLIRVLTHEIMNTVTPIASLSDTLSMMVKHPEKKQEIIQGLDVISLSSKGLISFVESYRNLTRIPTPNRKLLLVKDLINRVLVLIKDELDKSGITPKIEISDDNLMIYADENLISQVLVNLIKNGIAAIEECGGGKEPLLRIGAVVDFASDDVIVEVANNGNPIPKGEQEHIFVPFFTTKNSGTGIGLSISRQIMRLHNSSLKLKCSNEEETVFVLIFK